MKQTFTLSIRSLFFLISIFCFVLYGCDSKTTPNGSKSKQESETDSRDAMSQIPSASVTTDSKLNDLWKKIEDANLTMDEKGKLLRKLVTSIDSDLLPYFEMNTPISKDSALLLTNQYLDIFGGGTTDARSKTEKSVFYYKEEVMSLLNPSEVIGVRAYFARYPLNYRKASDSTKKHNFAGRNTVILRAVKANGIDVPYPEDAPYPAHNYGNVCPPDCVIESLYFPESNVPAERAARKKFLLERKDGSEDTQTNKGYE